jgi:uncharacterized protein YidB (DUF937 family)
MGILDVITGYMAGPDATRPRLLRVMEGLFAPPPDGIDLHELLARMEKAGLIAIGRSWTGPGHNLPVTVEQIQQFLTPHDIRRIASHARLEPDEVLQLLAQHLPGIIDGITPDGKIPD